MSEESEGRMDAKHVKPKKKRRKKRKRRSDRELTRMLRFLEGDDGALLATVGMAPAFATAESMMTASQAQGQLMLGAVASQQKLNHLSMHVLMQGIMQMQRLGERIVEDVDHDLEEDQRHEDELINRILQRFGQPPS